MLKIPAGMKKYTSQAKLVISREVSPALLLGVCCLLPESCVVCFNFHVCV
jgi:hypothetical protein